MNRFGSLVLHEARLQYRYGIYFAYAFVIGFYLLMIWGLAEKLPGWGAGIVIFSDPAAVGFFFLGALMMLEKSEGVRLAIGITPMTARAYFWAKCITLTGMATLAAILMGLFVHSDVRFAILLPTVVLTSIQYLAIGVPVARLFGTVTSYLIGATFALLPFVLPAAFALQDPMSVWMMLIPAAAQLRLILVSTGYGSASGIEITLMFGVCAMSTFVFVLWALRSLRTQLGVNA